MVTSVRTNATVKADQAAKVMTKVTPELAFAHVLKSGAVARKSALNFCYSVTAFMLNVCHLRDTNDKAYMSQAKAQDYIKEQLDKQAAVKGGMLDHYVRTGAALYGKLIGMGGKPSSVGAPIVKAMVDAPNTEAGIEKVIDEIDNLMGKNANVQSFRDLSKAMGFKSFVEKASTPQQNAEKSVERITNVVKAAEKARTAGTKGAPTERQVTAAVANVVASPIALAKAAIERYAKLDTADVEKLLDLVKFCEKVVDMISARDKDTRKAKAKAPVKAKAKNKPAATV